MKKLLLSVFALLTLFSVTAQEKKKLGGFTNSTGDHFMLQLSNDHWIGAPDSINSRKTGFARGANVYVMLDQRFKSSPNWSVAFGVGVSTSNMYFKNMVVDLKSKKVTMAHNLCS